MRVLVTGATGLIGGAVCEALASRGDEVLGLTRDPERARRGGANVDWYAWDPVTSRPPSEAIEGTEAVVNLIGEPIDQRWTEASKKRILESRDVATRNLVQAIAGAERKPKVLVSQSGVGFYGSRGEAIIDESTPGGDDFAARVCAAWETAAQGAEASGVRVVITRTGLVLTRDGGLLKRLLTPFRLGLGGPLAGGGQYMPWIHMADEVGVFLWGIDNDAVSGALNVSAPNPVTNREFSKTLGRVLRRPALAPVPKFALKAMLGAEMAETAALASQRAIPRRALDLGYKFRFSELEPALNELLTG